MAIVKFDEGTKVETSLNLEDGEEVIFVKPPKNLIARAIGLKTWNVTVVITNKRFVTIPQPPNRKNCPVESYYYIDIENINLREADGASEASTWSFFHINMKSGGNSSYEVDKNGVNGYFMIRMEMSIMNIIRSFIAERKEMDAKYGHITSAGLQAMDYQHYTEKSVDKYYARQREIAKERAANMDFSNTGHAQLRDYIVDVVSQFVEIMNG
ncbi:MAG: hypothetical protein FWD36_04185 [Treponema sp.]|nr:hypothetical protein [Treponema sp.]